MGLLYVGIYCTISNYSAGGGDRGQHGRNFAIGHLLYMVTIKPKFGNFLMLVRPTVVKMGSKRMGDRGQVTDFGHGQWAGDRGRPNNSKWYSICSLYMPNNVWMSLNIISIS